MYRYRNFFNDTQPYPSTNSSNTIVGHFLLTNVWCNQFRQPVWRDFSSLVSITACSAGRYGQNSYHNIFLYVFRWMQYNSDIDMNNIKKAAKTAKSGHNGCLPTGFWKNKQTKNVKSPSNRPKRKTLRLTLLILISLTLNYNRLIILIDWNKSASPMIKKIKSV